MGLQLELLSSLNRQPAAEAWASIHDTVWDLMSAPLDPRYAAGEVTKRDREVARIDHYLASCGWDLWRDASDSVTCGIPPTAAHLINWFSSTPGGKAVLILDGLSLREVPWILQGIEERGWKVHQARATLAEVPGETTVFAQALGLNARSQLQSNGGGGNHALQPVRTESVDYPFLECQQLVDASPNHLFWHHWPDSKLHEAAGAGKGLDALTRDVVDKLTHSDFWTFVQRLAQGRRLVITSDHGYAATGQFSDAPEDAGKFLKETFASGRGTAGTDAGPFMPPVALRLDTPRGSHVLALGRFKWKSQGGYPTLTHGGLSLLEMLSPFIELSL